MRWTQRANSTVAGEHFTNEGSLFKARKRRQSPAAHRELQRLLPRSRPAGRAAARARILPVAFRRTESPDAHRPAVSAFRPVRARRAKAPSARRRFVAAGRLAGALRAQLRWRVLPAQRARFTEQSR